jgi:Na+/H+ antiporter NhaC
MTPDDEPRRRPAPPLTFHGGLAGALAPFALFLAGVAWLALSGAPDEKGFWPVLLARDRARYAEARTASARGAELWTFGAVSTAVLLTTHSVVAILTVGDFTRRTGERFGVGRYRRANLLDVTVCTYPFLLPYCIPTILAASTTAAGAAFGMPRLSPLAVGLANLHSWGLLAMVLAAVVGGYGRRAGE